ncbi:MAG: beta-methylgalactoside transporter [Erysipelotrichaceae bacterium]|jgi:methyl-galactoside transport system permease protein|nr:beta-methylgalactoside transporter [Erysipelotrichaceae bacterium]
MGFINKLQEKFQNLISTFTNRDKFVKALFNNAILIVLLAIVVFVGIRNPNYLSPQNLITLSVNAAPRFIIALGVSGCLITRGTDLSAGRMVGMAGCISASLCQRLDFAGRLHAWLPDMGNHEVYWVIGVILFTIICCCLVGLISGSIVAFLKVPPFIATLGMQQIIYSFNMIYTKSQPIGALRSSFLTLAKGITIPWIDLGKGRFMSIPYMFILMILIGIIFWFLYNKTRHGKYMYAIGGNEVAAEVSGINTKIMLLKIYCLAGGMYAIGGMLQAAKAGAASLSLGQGYELEAIAACTIGGVSTTGGVGKVSGILTGVLVFELLKSALLFLGVDSNYNFMVQGLVILVAVAFDIRKYIAKK